MALCLILSASFCMAQGDPNAAASATANQALGKYGDAGGIQQNAVNPLIGGGPLYTIDGTNSSSVRVQCPSSDRFLTVFIAPTASNDLGTVNIFQDADLDGSVEYSYTLPFPVSGVCSNGVISCNPGTWANCSYYKWVSDTSGHVTAATANITDLGGCFCINNSCGSNLAWLDLNTILRAIGGGIAAAVMAQKAQYTISSVSIDGTTISYTGQNEQQCSGGPAYMSGTRTPQVYAGDSVSTVQLEQYVNNAGALDDATNQEVIRQSSDPNSYYSLLMRTATNQGSVLQTNSCVIRRDVSVAESTTCPTGEAYSAVQGICTGPPVSVSPNQSDSNWFSAGANTLSCSGNQIYLSANLGGNSRSWTVSGTTCSGTANSGGGCLTYLEGSGNQILVWAVPCEYGMISGSPYYVGAITFALATVSGSTRSTTCILDDASGLSFHDMCVWTTWTSISITPATSPAIEQDNLSDTIDDGCVGLENNTSCQLQNEAVDGVNTYVNYQSTGLIPLPQCRTFTGFASHQVCHDWWEKDRVYECRTTSTFDFSDAKRRKDVIDGSVTVSSSLMTYSDAPRNASGNIISTSGYADISQANRGGGPCAMACKTRRDVQDTQASFSGTTNMYRNTTQAYKFSYYECRNGVCPAGPGETILKSCQCIDEFAESVSIMAAMGAAGKDLTCSSGVMR